jgi:hypothetical protein
MPISELVAVGASLDDRLHCPLGQAPARLWDCADATFIRSSASHVFVAEGGMAGRRVILRMRPQSQPDAATVLRRSAWTAAALKEAGATVAGPVPSQGGKVVEHVDGYLVTALEAVEGEVRDSDDLDEQSAWTWGRLLADLHACGQVAAAQANAAPCSGNTRATEGQAVLPRTPDVYGLLHGDPEIDNLVWTGAQAAFVDFDDVHPAGTPPTSHSPCGTGPHRRRHPTSRCPYRPLSSTATDSAAPSPTRSGRGYRCSRTSPPRRPSPGSSRCWPRRAVTTGRHGPHDVQQRVRAKADELRRALS